MQHLLSPNRNMLLHIEVSEVFRAKHGELLSNLVPTCGSYATKVGISKPSHEHTSQADTQNWRTLTFFCFLAACPCSFAAASPSPDVPASLHLRCTFAGKNNWLQCSLLPCSPAHGHHLENLILLFSFHSALARAVIQMLQHYCSCHLTQWCKIMMQNHDGDKNVCARYCTIPACFCCYDLI
jgi:hypothetical protein